MTSKKERTVNPARLATFVERFGIELAREVTTNPNAYIYPLAQVPSVVARMEKAFETGAYLHDGRAVKATAKALGLKPDRKAIEDYLTGVGEACEVCGRMFSTLSGDAQGCAVHGIRGSI